MTQLAALNRNGASAPPAMLNVNPAFTVNDMWEMACWIAKGGLFPDVKTPEAAVSLMLLCQAEGLHPVQAMRRYHIVKNRPTMRADAMQAEFQSRGGVIEILERSATMARANFSHPTLHPKPVTFSYSIEDAKTAGLYSADGMYRKYPDTMLWWRLVTKAIRVIYPGIVAGIYSPEEAEEMASADLPSVLITEAKEQARAAVASADEPVPGHDPRQPDTRRFWAVASEAVAATNGLIAENWGTLPGPPEPMQTKRLCNALANKAVSQGKAEGPVPPRAEACVRFLDKVYASDRQWVRSEVRQACQDHAEAAAEALGAARGAEADAEPDGPGAMSDEDVAELAGVENEVGSEG